MSISPEFEKNIQNWVKCDNTIDLYRQKIKELQTVQKQNEENILSYMEYNNLQKIPIKINDGKITYTVNKSTSALTFSYLQNCCLAFFQNRHDKPEELTKQLIQFIKSKRQTTSYTSLRRRRNPTTREGVPQQA